MLIHEYKQRCFPVTIVRAAHTYSEFTIPTNIQGLGYGLVERLIRGKEILVHNDGKSLWTITHSNDFAVGLVGLMGKIEAIGEVFHITGAKTSSWLDIFETYARCLHVEPKYVFIPSKTIYKIDRGIGLSLIDDKDKSTVFNNKKIKNYVRDFKPKISFAKGIKMSLNWYKCNKRDKKYYGEMAENTKKYRQESIGLLSYINRAYNLNVH